MDHFHPLLLAGLTGFISGLALSIPVGPINLTILNEGARRGFKRGALIGLGATVMETLYCFIAFTGFASFFDHGAVKVALEVISFLFLLYLGAKFLLAKSTAPPIRFSPVSGRIEVRIEEKLHPHSAFMIGLVRVLGNLGVFIFWIVLAANFIYRGLVSPDWGGRCACVAGVTLGTGLWFTALSRMAALGRGKFSEKALLRLEHGSGVALLALALFHGGSILWQMHKH